MAYLPAFHTGSPAWRADCSEPVTRYIVVELGLEADEICWCRSEPGVQHSTLWMAQAAREKLAAAEPEARYEIQQATGAGDYRWIPGLEPDGWLGLVED